MRIFLAIGILLGMALIAGSAEANFAGAWTGSGQAQMPGNSFACPTLTLSLGQSETQFQILDGVFQCGDDLTLDWSRVDLEIRGQEVWYQGEAIGTITADTFTAQAYSSDGNVLIELRMRLVSESELEYVEEWYEAGERSLQIVATFRR